MMDIDTYKVVMNGGIKPGHELDVIADAFAKLFKITPEKASTIIGTKRVIKKDVALTVAENYQRKLASIGLEAELVKQEAHVVAPEKTIEPEIKSKPPGLALDPMPQEIQNKDVVSSDANSIKMICPKCNLEQIKSEQCSGCGVYVEKIQKRQAEYNNDAATSSEQDKEYSDDDSSQYKMFIVPAVVALLGALLWKFIAVSFGYEYGLVAWLIGGAIGFSAVMAGVKGQTAGIACGVLVLLSILGGKYMAASSFQSELSEAIATSSEYEGIDLHQMYDEALNDARQFKATVTDDNTLRTFMVDYGYSEYYEANTVTDEEIADFKEYNQPSLEHIAIFKPGFEEWKTETLVANINDYSTYDFMVDNLGLLDLLFLFFGIGTAFKLVNSEDE